MKSVKEKIFLVILTLSILIFPTTTFAADWVYHLTDVSTVDSGEIRWGGSNWYSSDRTSAISGWNALGTIYIAADTASTVEDVHFSDIYRSDFIWAGLYTYKSYTTDTIEANNYHLDKYVPLERTNVFLHELGHALGLADITDPDYSRYGLWPSLMYKSMDAQPFDIQSSDRENYYFRWGY